MLDQSGIFLQARLSVDAVALPRVVVLRDPHARGGSASGERNSSEFSRVASFCGEAGFSIVSQTSDDILCREYVDRFVLFRFWESVHAFPFSFVTYDTASL